MKENKFKLFFKTKGIHLDNVLRQSFCIQCGMFRFEALQVEVYGQAAVFRQVRNGPILNIERKPRSPIGPVIPIRTCLRIRVSIGIVA